MSGHSDGRPYAIEFWEDETGSKPVLDWIKRDLSPRSRRFLGTAMNEVLQEHGPDVCETEWGKWVDGDIFYFRARDAGITLRVYCHEKVGRVIVLLHGYDKGIRPAKSYEARQIGIAKRRLSAWQSGEKRARKAVRKAAADARARRGLRPSRSGMRRE
jgi:hypothetical protein